jgi:AbrB family looped-hinge helix DNA binding protein
MTIVTLNQDFRVTLPKKICKYLKIKPGSRLEVIGFSDGRIQVIPLISYRKKQ